MSWLRALLFNIAFFGVTALLGVAALPLLLAPRRVVMEFGRFWARCVLALAKAIVGLDGEIRGIEHLPHGACLIAMKHQSAWAARSRLTGGAAPAHCAIWWQRHSRRWPRHARS